MVELYIGLILSFEIESPDRLALLTVQTYHYNTSPVGTALSKLQNWWIINWAGTKLEITFPRSLSSLTHLIFNITMHYQLAQPCQISENGGVINKDDSKASLTILDPSEI